MPYFFENKAQRANYRLTPKEDRRVKLTEAQRHEIRSRHKNGEAIRSISRAFPEVSRRTVQFTVFPERAELVAKQYKDRGQSAKSYARMKGKEWNETISEHRKYKYAALKKRLTE